MKTHAIALGNLFAILGCLGAMGCSSVSASAPAHAPVSRGISTGQACVIVQRGASGDVADTRIAQQWPDSNYGAAEATFAGHVGRGERDVLIGFSLDGLPEGAVVTKATLTMHKLVSDGAGAEIHRVTAAWNERTATWNSFARSYNQTVEARLAGGACGEPGGVSADVTPLVREWVSGDSPNLGVLVRKGSGNTSYATSEAATPSERPQLEVCYSVPAT